MRRHPGGRGGHHHRDPVDQDGQPHVHQHDGPGADGEAVNAHAGQGAVLLDIGEDAGALVLFAPARMLGAEIEISPAGQDGRRTHVAVLARPGPAQLHAAVYPGLGAGVWNVWHPDREEVALRVELVAGRVSEVAWPA